MYDLNSWLRDAVARRSRRYRCSDTPSGRSSGLVRRIFGGIDSSINASSDGTPMTSSIARRSSQLGPMCRSANVISTSLQQSAVLRRVEQRTELRRVRHLEHDEPAA